MLGSLYADVISESGCPIRVEAHLPLLASQFTRPGVDVLDDGYTDYFTFSTGRRHIESLHCVFSLLPRHDLVQMIYHWGWGLIDLVNVSDDDLELDFKLSPNPNAPAFIWGVVSKDYLAKVKNGRWDLVSVPL